MSKEIIQTSSAPAPIGPYNQAVKKGSMYELVLHTIQDETHQVMQNIKAILQASSMDFDHILKTTIFLSDMNLFSEVNEIYGQYFKGDFPARETVAVKGLPKNVNVEISVIAGE